MPSQCMQVQQSTSHRGHHLQRTTACLAVYPSRQDDITRLIPYCLGRKQSWIYAEVESSRALQPLDCRPRLRDSGASFQQTDSSHLGPFIRWTHKRAGPIQRYRPEIAEHSGSCQWSYDRPLWGALLRSGSRVRARGHEIALAACLPLMQGTWPLASFTISSRLYQARATGHQHTTPELVTTRSRSTSPLNILTVSIVICCEV